MVCSNSSRRFFRQETWFHDLHFYGSWGKSGFKPCSHSGKKKIKQYGPRLDERAPSLLGRLPSILPMDGAMSSSGGYGIRDSCSATKEQKDISCDAAKNHLARQDVGILRNKRIVLRKARTRWLLRKRAWGIGGRIRDGSFSFRASPLIAKKQGANGASRNQKRGIVAPQQKECTHVGE